MEKCVQFSIQICHFHVYTASNLVEQVEAPSFIIPVCVQ